METRNIACNACGADRYAPLSTVAEWRIGECRECGLVYVNPAPFFAPTDEFAEISLAFDYTEWMRKPIGSDILDHERRQLHANAEVLRELSPAGPAGGEGTRFLDIGCGSGAAVRAAADLGWRATGLDLDPALIRAGREQLGADLRLGSLLDLDLEPGAWDFIKLRDVIEHLPNPLEVLVRIRELLAPGGVLLLVTPNEGSLATRVRVTLRRRRTVVATVPPPHHLHSFTGATLGRTLGRAGLRPVRAFTTSPSDWRYVTSHNIAVAAGHRLLWPLWGTGRALGMGAVLVCWARAGLAGDENA